ncbi:hypothetical protein [Nocardia tengchongensis]|uniref:hypothetical protein n=1 Tax=Nocardia tengchongensis TaxID=2055889 RepID=UPI0036BBEE8F
MSQLLCIAAIAPIGVAINLTIALSAPRPAVHTEATALGQPGARPTAGAAAGC